MTKIILIASLLLGGTCLAQTSPDSLRAELAKLGMEKELKSYVDKEVDRRANILEQQNMLYRDRIFMVLGLISLIGIGAFVSLYKHTKQKMQKELDKAIYAVDPAYIPLRVPRVNFDVELRRLKWFGFQNISPYAFLDKTCTSGCIVVRIGNDEEAKKLVEFIEREKPDEKNVVYVVYTSHRLDLALFDGHPNITMANMPLTIGQSILVAARGLQA